MQSQEKRKVNKICIYPIRKRFWCWFCYQCHTTRTHKSLKCNKLLIWVQLEVSNRYKKKAINTANGDVMEFRFEYWLMLSSLMNKGLFEPYSKESTKSHFCWWFDFQKKKCLFKQFFDEAIEFTSNRSNE